MNLPGFSVRRPVLTTMVTLIVVILGAVSLSRLRIDLLPDVELPTVTVDPSPGYMNPDYWDHVPALLTGLTAFLPSEEELRSLFRGRSDDLWEMAEALAAYGCELVVIKRGLRGLWNSSPIFANDMAAVSWAPPK